MNTSWLLLFVAAVTIGDAHLFTPFDLVDNYVDQFRLQVEKMGSISEEYRKNQHHEEYDVLQQEDAKLLLGKCFSYNIG